MKVNVLYTIDILYCFQTPRSFFPEPGENIDMYAIINNKQYTSGHKNNLTPSKRNFQRFRAKTFEANRIIFTQNIRIIILAEQRRAVASWMTSSLCSNDETVENVHSIHAST